MKFYVNRKFLVTAAGAVWIAAGANILRIGLVTWREVPGHALFRIAEATARFRPLLHVGIPASVP